MNFSTRCMTAADWEALAHFGPEEFAVPDRMGYEFMRWIDRVRDRAGVEIHVTSSYRTPRHNKDVGGAQNSAHTDTPCNAIDIGKRPTDDDPHWNRARFAIIAAALAEGCTRIGSYADGSLHLDRTENLRPARCLWIAVDNPA